MTSLRFTFLGLSITSSWGNGHATTYRSLLRALNRRGHEITFLERNVPWYSDNRDLRRFNYCRVRLYRSLAELRECYTQLIRESDVVVLGSYVPRGIAVAEWLFSRISPGSLLAFYDIDTPVTLAKLARNNCEYLAARHIEQFAVYFSFTGGPTLRLLESTYRSPCALPLYCSVDPELYMPESNELRWDLGYLGTYSRDRQPPLAQLLIRPARACPDRSFVVAGPQYPASIRWPANVTRIEHLPPRRHVKFYTSQRFALNITRADMRRLGYSPSVRLFEAAACASPILSDSWAGLDAFFTPNREILIADSSGDVLHALRTMPDRRRLAIGQAARRRVLAEHTADHRAEQMERALLRLCTRSLIMTSAPCRLSSATNR